MDHEKTQITQQHKDNVNGKTTEKSKQTQSKLKKNESKTSKYKSKTTNKNLHQNSHENKANQNLAQNKLENDTNQARRKKQETPPKDKLKQRYQLHLQSSNTDKKFKVPEIQKDLPFVLKPQSCISFNREFQTKIYLCNFKDCFIEQNLLQNLIHFKHSNGRTPSELLMSNQDFEEVYMHFFAEKFTKEQEDKTSLTSEHIMPLKCKIIDLDSANKFVAPEFIQKYLYMLKLFYQYRQSLASKMLFCSDERRKQQEKLKLFYFKMVYNCSVKHNLIQEIANFFNSEPSKQIQNETLKPNKLTLIPQEVITILIEKIKDQNSYIRSIAYRIVNHIIIKNRNLISTEVFMSLFEMLTNNKNEIRKIAFNLIAQCLELKPELASSKCPLEDKKKSSKGTKISKMKFDKNSKPVDNSELAKKNMLNKKQIKNQKQSSKLQRNQDSKPGKVQIAEESNGSNVKMDQQKSEQTNAKAKEETKNQILLMKWVLDNLEQNSDPYQINTLNLISKTLEKNPDLKIIKLTEDMEIELKKNLQTELKKNVQIELKKNIQIELKKNLQIELKKFLQIEKKNLQIELENELENVNKKLQEEHKQIFSYQPIVKTETRPIRFNELKQIFVSHQISEVSFSKNQNQNLNSKLKRYAKHCHDRYESEKPMNNVTMPSDTSQKPQNFLYVISEYNNGKTLKKVIQSNWKGLENPQIVLKLIRKLFCLQLELHFQGFNLHIPTLNNVIVNDSLEHPDLNINMTEFLSTSFLYTSSTDKEISIQKQTVQQLFPFIWKEELVDFNIPKSSSISKVNRIKHFLSIVLFIICRRLDVFESYDTISEKIKEYLQKNDVQKEKQKLFDNASKSPLDGQNKSSFKTSQKQKQTKDNLQKKIQFIEKHDLLTAIISVVPQFYQIFLTKVQFSQNLKNNEVISLKNSNFYRINKFEEYLVGEQNFQIKFPQQNKTKSILEKQFFEIFAKFEMFEMFEMFKNALIGQKEITWRNIYKMFFLKIKNKNVTPVQKNSVSQRKEKMIIGSRLLNCLCQFFQYPLESEIIENELPPELYFAIRYDIRFCYFAEECPSGWFQCFQVKHDKKTEQFQIESVCLLRNIKLEVIQKINQLIPHFTMDSSLKSPQNQNPEKKSEQKNNTRKKESSDQPLTLKSQKAYKKLKSGLELLRYLQEYEKKASIKQIRTKQSVKGFWLQKQIKQSSIKSEKVYEKQYFDTGIEKDLDMLENILEQYQDRQILKPNEEKSINTISATQ